MNEFPNTEAVSRIQNPHVWTGEKIELMVKACREMAIYHERYSPEINRLYEKRNFRPESIETEKDIERIPFIGVAAMKRFLMTAMPHEQAVLKLTSSGTKGQKTQIWFDRASLDRVQSMLTVLWEQEGLASREPTNYIMFVYDPKEAKDLGIAFSDKNQQRFAPVAESFYAIRMNQNGEWEFRKDQVLAKMEEFSKAGKPVRLFGIPSFIFEILGELEARGPIRLPPKSYMITGGGWKAAEDKKVSRGYFRNKVSDLLGIPPENIRDGYGMAEHSAPYIECRNHRFHVPVYNRVYPRDPVSLKIQPPGAVGLLELVSPYNTMMPNLAILSTDLGYIDENPCECRDSSPTFTLVGRGGLVKHKGCALHAEDIIKKR